MNGDLWLVLAAFLFVSLALTVSSVIAITLCVKYTAKAANRISKDIANGMARKVENNIKRDIDSGHFFY